MLGIPQALARIKGRLAESDPEALDLSPDAYQITASTARSDRAVDFKLIVLKGQSSHYGPHLLNCAPPSRS
jgi:hypothetical protein